MNDVVITAALRSAVGKFGGSIAKVPAPELGAQVIRALLARTGVKPAQISEVILGQVLTAGSGQNPARQALIRSGIPDTVPAMTVGKVCGSGLKAVHLAAQAIKCGDADIIIAGGQENMSASPHVLLGSRDGFRMGDAKLIDSMIVDGLWDAYNNYHMGTTAENVAAKFGISRREQDEFAAASQQKAEAAQKAGRFKAEIAPLEIVTRKATTVFDSDEYVRAGTTAEALGELKPAFSKDGTVTAGNASGINDGAAAVMMMSARKAEELGLKPLAWVRAYSSAGVDPKIMGMGPVPAAQLCLKKAGKFKAEITPIEIVSRKGTAVFDSDEFIRPGTTVDMLGELKPAFSKDGTVTAGNASGLNDGASAVMMMTESRARELGLTPLARIKAYSSAGVDPKIMGMGPVPASRLCLQKAGWTHRDLDLMEINEAFAAQAIGVNRQMEWDTSKINVNGGAIAIGHPIGASGCRILVTLLHEMMRRDAKKGLASLCIGGGMGVALAVER